MARRRRRLSDFLLTAAAVVLAIGLTAAVIAESRSRGRLARVPRVDDVIYLARGAELYDAGVRAGLGGLARDYATRPPHSPYSSGLAALAYAGAGGVTDWGPYALTGIAVAAFLGMAARIARTAGRWRGLALVGMAACLPLLGASVHNLKPDYACGIATAGGLLVLLRRPLGPARRAALAGTAFGLALLIKPAMVLPTALLMLGTLGVCGVRDLAVSGRAVFGRAVRSGVVTLLVAAALVLPHSWLAWDSVRGYVSGVLGGEGRALWGYPGTAWEHAAYYLTGPGGRLMLDGWRTLGPCLLVLGAAGAALVLRGTRRERAYGAACAVVLAAAYLGPTLSPVKIAQFAAPFRALLMLLAVQAGAWLGLKERRWRAARRVPWATLVVAVAVAWRVGGARWTFPRLPASPDDPIRAIEDARGALVRAVWAQVKEVASTVSRAEGRPARVLVTGGPGTVDEPLLVLWGVRDGLRLDVRTARAVPASPEDAAEALAWADVVIANEGGTGLTVPKRTPPGSDEAWIAAARLDRGLERALSLAAPGTERKVEVFRRSRLPEPRPGGTESAD